METKVVTRGGKIRASYANVFKPKAMEQGGKEKYSISLLIPKSDKALVQQFQDAIDAAIEAGKSSKWGGKTPRNLKLPLRDGDVDRDDEVYAGHYFINASSDNAPGVLDAGREAIDEASDRFYSGCYINVSVNFYPFDVAGNRGVACGLNGVQKVRDGERLSGNGDVTNDFDVEETDAFDDLPSDADDLM